MLAIHRITARVNRNGDVNDAGTPRPLLSLEEFFDGNQSAGSMCVNCTPTPDAATVYRVLKEIRARKDVGDVLVQVTMFDDPEWPYSDTVWVLTTADADDVESWFDEYMAPDECSEGWDDTEREEIDVPAAFKPVCCWWD